jgi:hypothetical protein
MELWYNIRQFTTTIIYTQVLIMKLGSEPFYADNHIKQLPSWSLVATGLGYPNKTKLGAKCIGCVPILAKC